MFVMTKKIECNGRNPESAKYLHFVTMSDGKHIATFDNKGNKNVQLSDLLSCENDLGSRFYAKKNNGVDLIALPDFGSDENVDAQINELMLFVNECMQIPVHFHVPGNEWTYVC